MTFAAILPHLAAGRKVRRDRWARGAYVEPPDGTTETVRVRPAIFGGSWLGLNLDDLLATDWELVDEPVRLDHADTVGETIQKQAATIARLTRELEEAKAGEREQRQACARLSLELSEARKPRSSMLTLAARAFAHERLWDGDVNVECSLVDYLRAGLTGNCLKIPVIMRDGQNAVAVYLLPTSQLSEGELRFRP